jgi:hypothetical protein
MDLALNGLMKRRALPAREIEGIRLRRGPHSFEVYRVSCGNCVCFVGLYDGHLSVTAAEPHIAIQMLLRRHISKRLARRERSASHV